jgi:Domain of unknown function (DUF4351)
MAKMEIEPADRPRVKVECLRMIANLKLDKARTFLISGFINNYLRLNPIEEQQFLVEVDKIRLPTEREDVMEVTTSWMEQGQESATRKSGNLAPELLARVNGLELDRVEVLAEDLLDFTSVGDLEQWLAV